MNMIDRRTALLIAVSAVFLPRPVWASPVRVTLYKDPQCGCCGEYTAYLRKNGFDVDIVLTDDLIPLARQAGVPEQLDSCHIAKMDGYVVVGHVPVDAVGKLLTQRPKIVGISIPGMSPGLPGMDGQRSGPIPVYEIVSGAAQPRVFMPRVFMMV